MYIHIYICQLCILLSQFSVFQSQVLSDSLCPLDCSPPGSCVLAVSRQEPWSGLPFPSQGDLPDPGIELESHAWQVDSVPLSHLRSPFSVYLLLFVVAIVVFARLFHKPEKNRHFTHKKKVSKIYLTHIDRNIE